MIYHVSATRYRSVSVESRFFLIFSILNLFESGLPRLHETPNSAGWNDPFLAREARCLVYDGL